jgi:hypothetical protein
VANRTGTINVISRYNTWEIDVSQNKNDVATLSCSPTLIVQDTLSYDCLYLPGNRYVDVTVTASAGNSWTAQIDLGGSWIRIDAVYGGTASGTGNGSFRVDQGKYLSGPGRFGEISVTSSAPIVYIDVEQYVDCP